MARVNRAQEKRQQRMGELMEKLIQKKRAEEQQKTSTVTNVFEFETGEMTCAIEKGRFCRFFGSKDFGQTPVCTLFTDHGVPLELFEKDGWTQRCSDCLKLSRKEN